MTGFAGTQREARNAFVSFYPFEPTSGGRGVILSAGLASAVAALGGEGPQVLITNKGAYSGHLFFGVGLAITADEACTCILPGIPYTLTIPEGTTHVAYIAPDGNTKIQITRGYGD